MNTKLKCSRFVKGRELTATIFAVLAAIFYAINTPFSKILLSEVAPTFMASFLYLGAGVGIGLLYLFQRKGDTSKKLSQKDLPYTLGMIVLDILAPIFLMVGLKNTTSANASLLNNFEIVATTIIAFVIFKEAISRKIGIAIFLVTLSSVLLSFEDISSLQFSWGSLFVLLAAVCWGFENNCTRNLASKNTYQIVVLKGIFSGAGSFVIALFVGEQLPRIQYMAWALVLGFVGYGLSIFLYVRAQNVLGAAKTSAYYAIAPFVGVALSYLLLKEAFTANYVVALVIMIIGSVLVTADTMAKDNGV